MFTACGAVGVLVPLPSSVLLPALPEANTEPVNVISIHMQRVSQIQTLAICHHDVLYFRSIGRYRVSNILRLR